MTNVGKNTLAKVIFLNIHKISDACEKTVLVDTSWLQNAWEMFLPFIKFKLLWKNGNSEKIKVHLPQQPPALHKNCLAPPFQFYSKKLLAPPAFKNEDRDYAFYMRDDKGQTITLFPFYMTDFLLTEI